MKLADLLSDVSNDELARMARDYARVDDNLGAAQTRATIEGVLKSHRFLQEFIFNRQPPTFSILALLLAADGFELPLSQLPSLVQAETTRISTAVDASLIVGRDEQLRVYRRVLQQARSNDFQIDSVEASLLAVLRHELGISQAEHFLIEHHADLREYWRTPQLFEREFNELRAAGIIFVHGDRALVPSDQVVGLRRVIGIEMSPEDARRLYGYLSGSDLHAILEAAGLTTGGNKEDRIARLVINMVQPRPALMHRGIGIDRLKDLCREIGAAVSGSKEELVNRIITFVAADQDIAPEPEVPLQIREERRLNRERFGRLFDLMRGHDLTTLLTEFELKRSGTKDIQIQTLWDAERSETTLLATLRSSEIDGILKRADLVLSGSKPDRIERLLSHFASLAEATSG